MIMSKSLFFIMNYTFWHHCYTRYVGASESLGTTKVGACSSDFKHL